MTTRTAIVTGGAGGLGLAMARSLLTDGHHVALVDCDAAAIERAKEALRDAADDLLAIVGDVSVETECESVVETVGKAFGSVDVLINNAGIGPSSIRPDAERNLPGVDEVTPDLWARFFAINLTGAYLMVRAAVPHMRTQGWGRVINNTTSFFTMLRVLPYGATKAALESASVVPGGPTDTAFIADQSGINRDRMLRPEVMAGPVRWLASDGSDHVTGRRFIAAKWDGDIPGQEAAEIAGAPIGWPDLAAATVVWPDD